jgi:cytoskeleton protein RodZ
MPLLRVKALEAEDFTYLNSDTFVRGYLRAYAKLLKVAPEVLLTLYQQQMNAIAGQQVELDPVSAGDNGRPTWKLILAVAAIMLVLWIASVWFFGNRTEPEVVVPATLPATSDYAVPDIEPEESTLADEQLQVEEPTLVPATNERVEQAPVVVLDILYFQFTGECWLEVVDAQGDVLYTDLQQAGRELTLQGKAPFQVKMGNAQALSVSLNGEPILLNITPATRVLNVTLGE